MGTYIVTRPVARQTFFANTALRTELLSPQQQWIAGFTADFKLSRAACGEMSDLRNLPPQAAFAANGRQ
ncbi:MAG: hypothetical protein WD767_09510 [Alphaproteobacteria bacterium]